MINTNELRIGNLFYDKFTKEVFTVEMISKEQIHFDYVTCSNWQAEPIPLTEEWLLNFGFSDGYTEFKKLWVVICLEEYVFYFQFENYSVEFPDIKIKYVHQLQNLYFALTGEELTQVSEWENKNFV